MSFGELSSFSFSFIKNKMEIVVRKQTGLMGGKKPNKGCYAFENALIDIVYIVNILQFEVALLLEFKLMYVLV